MHLKWQAPTLEPGLVTQGLGSTVHTACAQSIEVLVADTVFLLRQLWAESRPTRLVKKIFLPHTAQCCVLGEGKPSLYVAQVALHSNGSNNVCSIAINCCSSNGISNGCSIASSCYSS